MRRKLKPKKKPSRRTKPKGGRSPSKKGKASKVKKLIRLAKKRR